MAERKYKFSFGELVDRLSIISQKEIYIPEQRETYTKQINEIIADLNMIISEDSVLISGEMIRAIICVTQINTWIWQNEANYRKGISTGNDLELTHSLNTIRTKLYSRLSEMAKGRQEFKADTAIPHPNWIPSGY